MYVCVHRSICICVQVCVCAYMHIALVFIYEYAHLTPVGRILGHVCACGGADL